MLTYPKSNLPGLMAKFQRLFPKRKWQNKKYNQYTQQTQNGHVNTHQQLKTLSQQCDVLSLKLDLAGLEKKINNHILDKLPKLIN